MPLWAPLDLEGQGEDLFMEQLLLDIINLISQQMPQIRTIDEDYGQLEFIDQEDRDTYPLVFPAVLIDAPTTDWTDIGDLAQQGTCQLRVRLIIDCYDDTHARSMTTERIKQRNKVRAQLHTLLQGYRPDGQKALIRTQSRFFTVNHGIKVYEATYTCALTEAVTERETVARPKVSLAVAGGIGSR